MDAKKVFQTHRIFAEIPEDLWKKLNNMGLFDSFDEFMVEAIQREIDRRTFG
jgi:hypothetical protein